MKRIAAFLREAPIAPAQLGVAAFALADVLWVARPSAIGWLPVLRGALLALALGAAVGFVAGALAGVVFAGAPSLRRPRAGQVIAAPIAAALWAAVFAGAVLLAAFRLNDPELAAWAVALVAAGLVPLALVPAMITARLAAPLSRRPALGGWLVFGLAIAGAAAAPWIRPLGLASGALAIALLAARARPVRLAITGVAAAVGLAVALSPLCDDPIARDARRGTSFVPAVEAALAPLLDRDGDGWLPVFGGDCDEGNAEVAPDAIEIAGNGTDEDCRFGDLAALAAPETASGPRAEAVLLLSITDLDIGADGALRPPMPALEKALAGAARFTGSRGIAGRFVDVAPVLIDGALPLEHYGPHGGFSVGSETIPAKVERAGGRAAMSLSPRVRGELNTAVHLRRLERKGKPQATAKRFAGTLSARPGFLWLHLDSNQARDEVDRAAAAAVRRASGRAVIVVGLPSRAGGDAIGGGPLAVIAPGVAPRRDPRPAGLHDVYPTLADLFGLEIGPVAGQSLLRPPARPLAFSGSIENGVAELGAFDAGSWVRHRPRARSFATPEGPVDEDATGPEPVAALIEATRARLLAPRLAALNRRRRARVAALPDDLVGTPSVIARALTVHGCTVEHRPGGVALDVYYSGAGLRAGDLFAFKLFAPGATSVRGRAHPAVPLDAIERGAIYRHRLDIDTRSLGSGTSFLWVGLFRDRLLPVTSGSGSTPQWALVCRVEPPEEAP